MLVLVNAGDTVRCGILGCTYTVTFGVLGCTVCKAGNFCGFHGWPNTVNYAYLCFSFCMASQHL